MTWIVLLILACIISALKHIFLCCDLPCPKGAHLSWQLGWAVLYVSGIESIGDVEDSEQTLKLAGGREVI